MNDLSTQRMSFLSSRSPGPPAPVSTLLLALLVVGCYGRPSTPQPVESEMYVHFSAARDMRTAAVFADLEGIQEAARELEERGSVEGLPEGSSSRLYDLRQQAAAIRNAMNFEDASRQAASLVRQCGLCHQAFDVGPGEQFIMREPPQGRGRERHAERLSWSINRMWEGLLGPSEGAWNAGARALADPGSFGPEMAEALGGDDEAFEEALEELSRISKLADDFSEDEEGTQLGAQMLGEVFVTCGSCHGGGS